MLKNMAALVTGAAGTLGSATAKKLVSEGCKVTLLDLPDSKGEEVAKKLGQNAVFSPGDITSEADVLKALELTKEKFGWLRVVVNCAAVHRANNILQLSKNIPSDMSTFNEVINVNVLGTLNVIRLVLLYMSENPVDRYEMRGVIVNTTGYGAFDGQRGQCALAASWGAISSLTLPLCREVGDLGIRVMAISPGLIDSNLTSFWSSNLRRSFTVLTPHPKRLGYKEEFADLVVSIIQNNFLNGEVIRLDGGLRLNF